MIEKTVLPGVTGVSAKPFLFSDRVGICAGINGKSVLQDKNQKQKWQAE